MSFALNPIPEQPRLAPIYRLYAALAATLPLSPESGLGGKLLYAGEINPESRNFLYAANIAGAASLAASADPATQRQAIRDGVVDFLVTSLEEALRILKNEIRKRQTVSVAVAIAAESLTAQMLDRGVLPDLLPGLGLSPIDFEKFLAPGARRVANAYPSQGEFVTWSVETDFARWLPRLDSLAAAILPAEDHLRQRWLRLAPRYLGRVAQRQHGVVLAAQERALFEAETDTMQEQNQAEGRETARVAISAEKS